jgi:hypothetical protein
MVFLVCCNDAATSPRAEIKKKKKEKKGKMEELNQTYGMPEDTYAYSERNPYLSTCKM